MEFFYTHKASKQLGDLPKVVQKRIATKMRFYATQDNPLRFAEHLVDFREGQYRFRIGEYRVVCDMAQGGLYVLKIAKRDKVYE